MAAAKSLVNACLGADEDTGVDRCGQPAQNEVGPPRPVDLRWPKYVQTVRGEELWIPTPGSGSGAGEPLR